MTTDMESIYWMRNKEWYRVTDSGFVLTDKAPERARKSFELHKQINNDKQKALCNMQGAFLLADLRLVFALGKETDT